MFMCSFVCDTCALMCVCERACPFDRMLVPVCAFLPYPQVLISDLTVVLIRFYWLFFSRSPTIRTNTIGSDRIESDPTRFNSIRIPGRVEKKLERRIFLRIRDMHLGEKNVSIEYQNESLIYKDEHVKTSTKLVIETTIYLYRSVARSIHLQWFYALFVASEYVNEKFNQNTKIAQKKHSAAIIVLGLTRKSRKMRINKNYKSI